MKPLEFKIEETIGGFIRYTLILFYEDGTTENIALGDKPNGLECGKHYSIVDIYGYQVKNDREGL